MSLAQKLKPAHLRLVLRIAEVEQLQIAAEAQGMSQPAASRILAELEADVGGKLFIRHPRGMEPTELGHAFVRYARVILSDIDNLETELHQLNTGHSGEIRVGAVTGPAVGCLVPAVRALKAQSPDLRVSIEISPSVDLVRRLEEGHVDLILARIPSRQDSRDFLLHPARHEVVSLLAHAGHPLADKEQIGLDALSAYQWVMQERGSPIRLAVEQAYHAEALPVPGNVINSSSLLVALAMLKGGSAIAPQAREAAELLTSDGIGANLTVLRTRSTIHVTPFYVVRHRHRQQSRAAQRLLEEVLKRL